MTTNLQAKVISGNLNHGTIDGKTCFNQINLVFSM